MHGSWSKNRKRLQVRKTVVCPPLVRFHRYLNVYRFFCGFFGLIHGDKTFTKISVIDGNAWNGSWMSSHKRHINTFQMTFLVCLASWLTYPSNLKYAIAYTSYNGLLSSSFECETFYIGETKKHRYVFRVIISIIFGGIENNFQEEYQPLLHIAAAVNG